MTLKQIAKEAGVSISTVSRVINNKGASAAGKNVQDKIWEIVRRTGYSPNENAQNLQSGRPAQVAAHSGSIACVFARTKDPLNDAFFSTLSRSIEQEAFKHNYNFKYILTSVDINSPEALQSLIDSQVDGAAVLGRCDKNMLSFLKKYFKNVVYSGLNNLEAKYDQIICDGFQVSQAAMQELFSLGHTRIAYVGETSSENRYDGYCQALAEKNLPLRREYIVNVPLSTEGGYKGTQKLLSRTRDFTAIFCPNDTTSIGVMKAISEANLNIPKDISLISIDDIDMIQYITPMLTTMHIPITEMGQMAAKTLIDRIEGGHHLPMKISMPYYTAKRESCSQPRIW